ncbi:MAG: DUF3592 domain-containing protein [Spirochaetales bacterium]|nr:DUF3592 domain-containing protein [Spirochaetales bacterium]
MNAYKNASFAGIVIFIGGIIITIYGFSFLLKQSNLESNGIIVKGTVIDIAEKDFYRSPIVQFTTKENQTFTFRSELDVNQDLFHYVIGQEVDVIYHKDDPSNAKIHAFWEGNVAQLYLGILGIFLMVFGFLFRRGMLKKAKKYEQQ